MQYIKQVYFLVHAKLITREATISCFLNIATSKIASTKVDIIVSIIIVGIIIV
jgi:hypothetical protein